MGGVEVEETEGGRGKWVEVEVEGGDRGVGGGSRGVKME